MINLLETVSRNFYDGLTSGAWLNTAWWELATIFVVAILTQYFAHVFLLRRKKKSRITELAGQLISSGRKVRSNWTSFLEYDLSFIQARDQIGKELHSKKEFTEGEKEKLGIAREAAFNYEKTALHFREKLQGYKAEFIEAGILLTSVHNERFAKFQNFKDAINAIEASYFEASAFKDEREIKSAVDAGLNPNLQVVERLCQRVIWEQSASIWSRTGAFFQELFSKEKGESN